MHVVVVGNRFPWPLRDGGAQATYGMLKSLTTSGVNVTYFSFNTVKHNVGHEVLTREFDFISYRAIPKKSTATVFGALLNLWKNKSYHVARYYDNAGSLALKHLLEELENPVVWVEGLYSLPLVEPLLPWLKERNLYLVYRSHNVESQIWERVASASVNPIKKWYLQMQSDRLRKYEEQAWRWFNLLLPITEDDRSVMQNVLEATANVLAGNLYFTASATEICNPKFQLYQPGFWNVEERIESVKKKIEAGVVKDGEGDSAKKDGVDLIATADFGKKTSIVADSLSAKNNRCFHIGSMEWEANKQSVLWFLRECWPQIRAKNPLAEFHLAGKGLVRYDPNYSGVGVFVHGEVDSSEEFMMEHGIAVVPLLSGSGIRMKILEAMLYGCPVVTTGIGMQGLAITSGLELQVADSASAFADQVLILMGDVVKRNDQRHAAWDFLRKFHNESENICRVLEVIT